MGADKTSSDLFVFPPESRVRVIRLLGLTALNDGRPSAMTMPAVEELDISEEEKAEDDSAGGGGDEDSSDESEVDIGLSQEFAF